jgi:hypothetical protein
MTTSPQQTRFEELTLLLADVERQLADPTLSHSDQQLLDQAWDFYTEQLDELESIAYSEAEEEEERPRVVTFAPPPPDHMLLPSEDELAAMVDDRVGCEYCAGCIYCMEPCYDGADEI